MKTPPKYKFFIVDDDIFCFNVYEQHLKNLDYTDITYFESGEVCLDNLHLKPDIIFLDHNMDELTGFEVLKKIKRFNPNIYVVMISGQDEINVAVEALKHGAFDYLVKGANACDRITETVSKIMKIQEEIENEKDKKGPFGFFNIF